ncbi:transposase [Candidatus Vondammii sp. HM_W22]|uniref:transposase n=1 Tax=Candidatus Vondammii sp. HM_W22 TaxID=2687299 RepID=UPI001F132AF4|nr:transposase [Candidatus Vondammii sp. HM_W22]
MIKFTIDTKNIRIDRKHKVIRKYAITSAEVHDSQVFEERLDESNSNGSVWADSAYRSVKRKAALPGAHYRSHIHRKSTHKRPLNERKQEANRKRSRVWGRKLSTCSDRHTPAIIEAWA